MLESITKNMVRIPSESQSESRRITKINRGKFKRLFPILLKISVIQGISSFMGFSM